MKKSVLFCLLLIVICLHPVLADDIVINEIMYNSPGKDVEFIELYNLSTRVIDLQGWYILDDNDTHNPCYLEGSLEPQGFLIVPGDVSFFASNYPGASPVNSNDFESGADGVMVVGCEEGSCHFMIGNLRAKKRVNYLKGMLERIGFSPQRLEMFNISASMGPQFARTCEEFTEKIKNLGPLMEETSEKREKEVQQVTT